MSVDEERPDEAAADAQGAVQSEPTPPPWGDDFDPERAWSTITTQRKREEELESELKAYKRLEDDEEARVEWLKKHGYEIESPEPDDEEDFDDDDPEDPRLKEYEERIQSHEEYIAEQRAKEWKRDFNTHVDELCGEAVELDEDDRDLILQRSLSDKEGPGLAATERAFKWLTGRYEAREKSAVERLKGSKRAPHVPTGGKAGKGPQPDMNTEAGRREFYEQRLGNP